MELKLLKLEILGGSSQMGQNGKPIFTAGWTWMCSGRCGRSWTLPQSLRRGLHKWSTTIHVWLIWLLIWLMNGLWMADIMHDFQLMSDGSAGKVLRMARVAAGLKFKLNWTPEIFHSTSIPHFVDEISTFLSWCLTWGVLSVLVANLHFGFWFYISHVVGWLFNQMCPGLVKCPLKMTEICWDHLRSRFQGDLTMTKQGLSTWTGPIFERWSHVKLWKLVTPTQYD